MKVYLKILLAGLVVSIITGCAKQQPVQVADLPKTNKYVVNEAEDKDYPVLSGSANIYSCRYGIFYKKNEEFSPSKEVLFEKLLYKYKKEIGNHKVVLKQFDVYLNKRNSMIPGALGGALGYLAFTDKADKNKNSVVLIDSVPDNYPKNTKENAVGCDNEMEGEFYESRVPKGHDTVVSWYKFTIDGKEHHYRAVYSFKNSDERKPNQIVADGILESMKKLTGKIKL